ncbi:protein NUCLEAR FUSION DEFECTIVE 4-like [Lycium ferocissimum]|uniref:protein NUCLEAR FUSION DEFECTIVE 4-like n=1 Tax=Lycium ferocissimum TaxID=112874 RepID=UPI002815C581|nr:protein NUCLEAR FUSION DEFECTIVE 4-like [Lycium ferocissimum]
MEQSSKWMILIASTWIQAFTGTNFDFSSYSSELKSVLGISQVQLNYLSMASDFGKAFGWCSGVSLMYFPLWFVLVIAAFMGLVGYGLQWMVIQRIIILPYFLVFLLCVLAGCSICWFNTVCYVLCIKNFTANRPFALSLSISFNGASAALYNLIANSINSKDDTLYLLLNALVPLVTSVAALPILRQPHSQTLRADSVHREYLNFRCLTILAVLTGLYLLILNSVSYSAQTARILLAGALFLLVLPVIAPGVICTEEWSQLFHPNNYMSLEDNDPDDFGMHKEMMWKEASNMSFWTENSHGSKEKESWTSSFLLRDRLLLLGEEHSANLLMRRLDFWLYYLAYFCGGTLVLVYSNNLGQISESLGYRSEISFLVALYSACSFFGRLLSATPDFLRDKMYYARTAWLAFALIPTPLAFFLLVLSGSKAALSAATALLGLSSGFVFSAAVSITSELFGPNSAGVNHNILITNIPLGSLLYGLLAALVYEANLGKPNQVLVLDGSKVCMGRNCYIQTFMWWGCISLFGVASSFLLFLRTKAAYDSHERNQNWTRLI